MRSLQVSISEILALFIMLSTLGCEQLPPDSIMDKRDGNVYSYFPSANLYWFNCNLNFLDKTDYCNGAWVFSYDEKEFEDAYIKIKKSNSGVLYDYQMAKKACPDEWRLPSVEEWKSLLGPENISSGNRLGQFNLKLDGRARSFDKFCIYSGITFWTSDISENGETATVVVLNFSDDGLIEVRFEEQKIGHAFYVRCVRDRNRDKNNTQR